MKLGRNVGTTAFAALVLCVPFAGPASAAIVPVWQPGLMAQVPSGGSDAVLNDVSCPAAGDCTAVGEFDINGATQGLVVDENDGMWDTGAEVMPPGTPSSDPDVSLRSVSCSSAGNCTAVGSYSDDNGLPEGLLVTETNGEWGPGIEAQLPAQATGGAQIGSVSCAAPGDCTAVGTYYGTGFLNDDGLVLTASSGEWSAGTTAALPEDAGTGVTGLFSVSCWSAGNCTAVGGYVSKLGMEGVELTETDGAWATGLETKPPSNVAPNGVALPGHGGPNGRAELTSIACLAAGECSAAGGYYDTSGALEPMVDDESGGSWSQASEVNLPGNAVAPTGGFPPLMRGALDSIACSAVGTCAAVGQYKDASYDLQGLLVSESSGSWTDGVEATLPGSPAPPPDEDVGLQSVSCPASGGCVAAGSYDTTDRILEELFVPQSASGWGDGASPTLAPGTTASYYGQAISCAAAGACAAVDGDDLFSSQPEEAPTLALSAPSATALNTPSTATAVLSGGATPTGAITFQVFGPQSSPPVSCSSGGASLGTATVSGNGSYAAPKAFVPTLPGTYWWYATYGGDNNNVPVVSNCGAAMSPTVVASAPPQRSTPSLRLVSIHIARNTLLVSLDCEGTGTCRAKLTFAVDLDRRSGRRHRRDVVVAQTTRALAGDRRVLVRLRLGDRVARLPRPVHGELTISGDGTQIRRAIVIRHA
jgi:hypothetical protein